MGYSSTAFFTPSKKKTASKRRSFMPEPFCPIVEPPVFQVAYNETVSKKKHHRRPRTIRAQITHTSCLTAIRNYVINMQNPNRRKRKKHRSSSGNVENLICSLKNDIQMISKYQQDTAENPKTINSNGAFFVLSAMMCKINKLEELIIKSTNCERQLAKRRDMLITAGCIKKSLIEQMQCDEKLLKDKQKKICYLIKSLDMFEKQIRCMTKSIKYKCSTPNVRCSPMASKSCLCLCKDKNECTSNCPGKRQVSNGTEENQFHPSAPLEQCSPRCIGPCATSSTPCPPKCETNLVKDPSQSLYPCTSIDEPDRYDITGMNLTYTRSSVESDPKGNESVRVQNKICCSMNENEDYKLSLIRDGSKNPIDTCNNPELKARLNNVSKIWLESARQLMDAFCT